MAIQLDGIDYVIDTPMDNALNLINYINEWMTINNVKGADGTIVQFAVNAASPIWLIILGIGYLFSAYQKLVYAAGQSFSIGDCSDNQLLNLAEIQQMSLAEGRPTIITARVTAGIGDLDINTLLTCTYEDAVFHPAYDLTIPAGTTATITLIEDTFTPYYIPANTITEFDTNPDNFVSMTTNNSVPGHREETLTQLRRRMQTERRAISPLQGCLSALKNLSGVQSVSLLFNESTTTPLVIDGITIPIRACVLFIQGYSPFIADTYFSYLNVPCVNGDIVQGYTTQVGQIFEMSYSPPVAENVYVRVSVRQNNVPIVYRDEIKSRILAISGILNIGEQYTQKFIINLFDDYNTVDILGIDISMNGVSWSNTSMLKLNEIGVITPSSISFVIV